MRLYIYIHIYPTFKNDIFCVMGYKTFIGFSVGIYYYYCLRNKIFNKTIIYVTAPFDTDVCTSPNKRTLSPSLYKIIYKIFVF